MIAIMYKLVCLIMVACFDDLVGVALSVLKWRRILVVFHSVGATSKSFPQPANTLVDKINTVRLLSASTGRVTCLMIPAHFS